MAKKVVEADFGSPSGNGDSGGSGAVSKNWIDALNDLIAQRFAPLSTVGSGGSASGGPPLLGRDNLLGMCIGERLRDGSPTGEQAIKVFVFRKERDPDRIDSGSLIPDQHEFNGKQYLVDVVELAEIYGGPPQSAFSPAFGVELPPVKCGSCIGNERTGDTGTLGCLVVDENKQLCILSNTHVMAASGDGRSIDKDGQDKADKIMAPGAATRFLDRFHIAWLQRFEPLDFAGGENTVDGALAATAYTMAKPDLHAVFTIAAQMQNDPTIGMVVYKEGARTGSTYGMIVGLYGALDIPYNPGGVTRTARFVRQLVIVGLGEPFSLPGDSGSLVLEKATRRPVGLLFAGGKGSDGRDYTFANPIVNVKNRLKIRDFLEKEI